MKSESAHLLCTRNFGTAGALKSLHSAIQPRTRSMTPRDLSVPHGAGSLVQRCEIKSLCHPGLMLGGPLSASKLAIPWQPRETDRKYADQRSRQLCEADLRHLAEQRPLAAAPSIWPRPAAAAKQPMGGTETFLRGTDAAVADSAIPPPAQTAPLRSPDQPQHPPLVRLAVALSPAALTP